MRRKQNIRHFPWGVGLSCVSRVIRHARFSHRQLYIPSSVFSTADPALKAVTTHPVYGINHRCKQVKPPLWCVLLPPLRCCRAAGPNIWQAHAAGGAIVAAQLRNPLVEEGCHLSLLMQPGPLTRASV